MRIPNEVDPYEAVAVIRSYTTAFQALMQGIHGHERYSRKPLMNKRILIVGPCGNFERALVDLSNFLGAETVYFSAHSSTHSHDMYIRLLGAIPLSDDPDEWPTDIEGDIDIAVDSICLGEYGKPSYILHILGCRFHSQLLLFSLGIKITMNIHMRRLTNVEF